MQYTLMVNDIVDRLHVSTDTVRRFILDGELEATDVAPRGSKKRMFRITEEALERFLESRSTSKAAKVRKQVEKYPRFV